MDKRFEKYFGSNIARKIYITGIALIAVGVAVAFFYWAGYGILIAAVGVILFFISSSMQVSDKDLDDKMTSAMAEYAKEKIDGRVMGKQKLDARDFSVFCGYIRESGNVRFKAGSDGKIRTSNYFITAIYAEKDDCRIFTTVYDLLSDKPPVDKMIYTQGAEKIEFSHQPTEFPKGNFKCNLNIIRNGESENLEFFIPDDALADKLIAKIK